MSINNTKIFAVFTDADAKSLGFTERLVALGIATRADAKPFAMQWAAAKYNVTIEKGQRGDKLPRDSAAEKAMLRVLGLCFPAVDRPKAKAKSANKVDAVAKMLTAYTKLTAAEKRRFLASL